MPTTTITLGTLTLRRWRATGEERLWAAVRVSLPQLEPWMPWAPGYVRDRAREFLEGVPQQWAARSDFLYALVEEDGTVLGSHGLHRLEQPGALMIGYWTTTTHAGRGHATLAAAALTRAALALPEVDRVVIHHDRANVRSGAVPARLGYRRLPDDLPDHVVEPRPVISLPSRTMSPSMASVAGSPAPQYGSGL